MIDSKKKIIHVSEPLISGNARKYLLDCIDSEWVSSAGKYLENFEKKWASYCGAKEGIAVTSGTSALQVAFKSLNFKPGDEVIMPSFTIISCATAILEAGGKPVLVDCYPDTWCMNISEVMKKINSNIYKPFIDKVFLYDDVAQAHNRMENRDHYGKIVLVPNYD